MRRGAATLAALLGLSACEAPLQPGRAEATADTTLVLALGTRALVLDGVSGDVRLVADASAGDTATVVLRRRARGATRASARRRLEAVLVATSFDAEIQQVVWRSSLPDGTGADAQVRLPPGASVVVRLGAGSAEARGLAGALDAETGRGQVRLHAHAGERLRVRVREGAAAVGAARIPTSARWFVSVGAGAVDVALPGDASATVIASTAAGRVAVGLPLADLDRSSRASGERVRGRLGDGEAVLRFETAAGDVSLRLAP